MKTNSTCLCLVFCIAAFFSSFFNTATAQCVSPGMKFANPVLVSGLINQVGSVYRFPSVVAGVHAIVTVTGSVGGATLTSIDDNTFGYSDAWQPVVKTPLLQSAAESYMTFSVDFVDSVNGTPHNFNCFTLSAIDVDGDGVHVRELVAARDFSNYAVSNATTLTLTNQSGLLKAVSTIVNFPGIDTSAYVSNINYGYIGKHTISEIRLGSVTDATFTPQDRYSCLYFKPISMPNVVVLPLQYLSLSTILTNKDIAIKWQTNEKTESNSFIVERSFDGSNFLPVNTVVEKTGEGNTFSYQAMDVAPVTNGNTYIYYRVKQQDASGKITYSNLTFVHLQQPIVAKMQTLPNPFTNTITAQFNSAYSGNAAINIANLAGVTLLSKQCTITKGNNLLTINDVATLAPGIYFARLVVNGEIITTQKIIK